MKPGRGQFSLGSLMIVVAAFAVLFASPDRAGRFAYVASGYFFRFAYLGSVLILLMVSVLAVYHFAVVPGFLLIDHFGRRSDRPTTGPKP